MLILLEWRFHKNIGLREGIESFIHLSVFMPELSKYFPMISEYALSLGLVLRICRSWTSSKYTLYLFLLFWFYPVLYQSLFYFILPFFILFGDYIFSLPCLPYHLPFLFIIIIFSCSKYFSTLTKSCLAISYLQVLLPIIFWNYFWCLNN